MKNLFLFPGNGIHQKKMLGILSAVSPFFAERLKALEAISAEHYPIKLLDESMDDEVIDQIRVFASEVVIAEFWSRLGCTADYCAGHSLGEYAEAVHCGIMHPEDAVYLLTQRAKYLAEETPHATAISESSAESILSIASEHGFKIYISAYNAPEAVTVCGKPNELLELTEICKEKRIRFGMINRFHGAHYSGLKKGAEGFMSVVSGIKLAPPRINMLQTIFPSDETVTPEQKKYWCEHICNPVNLVKALSALPEDEEYRVIDLGISPVLLMPAQKCLAGKKAVFIPTVRMGRNYREQILKAIDSAEMSALKTERSLLD